jgi:hypothetical protein
MVLFDSAILRMILSEKSATFRDHALEPRGKQSSKERKTMARPGVQVRLEATHCIGRRNGVRVGWHVSYTRTWQPMQLFRFLV